MKCYRTSCKCDKYKMMGCIFKLTKKQKDLIAKIRENKYCKCGEMTIVAKYGDKLIDLCTNCGVRGRVA